MLSEILPLWQHLNAYIRRTMSSNHPESTTVGTSQIEIDDDDLDYDYDEPSDQDMMAAFGTKWHDGL
tara:strand:- start:590 stop:790 length:201 start_codon:yes stop_codon:yes gene_type:complete